MADVITANLAMTLPDFDGAADERTLAANFSLLDGVLEPFAHHGFLMASSDLDSPTPPANLFSVYQTKHDISAGGGGGGVMADFTLFTNVSAQPGSAALRAIASQRVAGDDDLRAFEVHTMRSVGGTRSTWCMEVGLHTTQPGNGYTINNGIYMYSSDWGILTGAVKADAALLIAGDPGWSRGIIYYAADNSTLFDVDEFGIVTAKGGLFLTGAGARLDFASQVNGTIRGGSTSLAFQSVDGANNNMTIANDGSVGVRATLGVANTVATPAGGSTGCRLVFGTTAGFGIYVGSGAPTVVAAQGSMYLRSEGSSTSTRAYIATNSAGAWTAITTAS